VNDVICHGIPSPEQVLVAGDIINVDVTSIKDGYYGDSSRMYYVGSESVVPESARNLCVITKAALMAGIGAVKSGKRFSEIGEVIESFIKQQPVSYGIVREYTGHGIGRSFHEPPQILHFDSGQSGPRMKSGMVFTVEPMINLGGADTVLSKEDGWTVRTRDGSLSAQWEHTVLVTDSGAELLTASELF
jgi:methionyl aminopeptidase